MRLIHAWLPAVMLSPRAPPPVLRQDHREDGGLHRLLLQRAVQTCCYTARQTRDPPTAQWLAEYANIPETYHGLDGFNSSVAWDRWLLDLYGVPPMEIEVQSILKQHRGVSANNPYVQPKRMAYTYELRPSDMAERLCRTVDSIAREWREDLALIADAEVESVWRSRRAVTLESDEEVRTTLPAFSHDPVNNPNTPYRGGSYQLLVALATRRAAQSALAAMAAQPTSWAAREMLATHCEERGLFEGDDLEPHVADAWIASLLDLPISLRMGGGTSGEPALVDPRGVVEQLLEWRTAVAEDWIRRLRRVPDALLQIKRRHMESRMGTSTGSPKA